MYSNFTITDFLYFVPVIGALNHANDLRKLSEQRADLKTVLPLIDDLNGNPLESPVNIQTLNKMQKAFQSLNSLTHENKIKASEYFTRRSTVQCLGHLSSLIRIVASITLLTLPIFLVPQPALFFTLGTDFCDLIYTLHLYSKQKFGFQYDSVEKKSQFTEEFGMFSKA